jgi:glycine dehydrogenase subunit 1
VDGQTACLVVQYPNFYGYIEDLARQSDSAHHQGALLVVSADPTAMGLFQPPGYYDADIVTGEGQPLGIPPSFGGPYLGLFATRQQYLRQMPSRLAGRTVDRQGRTGYVLTLQTREQHIRRERATSNICTNEALYSLAATIYLSALGKQGLRQVAELCYHKAHYTAARIALLPGYSLPLEGNFFQEFVVQCPAPPSAINRRLLELNILGGLDISGPPYHGGLNNRMLLCVTEMNSKDDIDALVAGLSEFS